MTEAPLDFVLGGVSHTVPAPVSTIFPLPLP